MREKKSEWMEIPMQANINVTSDHVQFGLRRRWSNLNTSKIIDQVSVSNWISWPIIGHGVVFHYLMISLSPNTLSHIIFLRRHADVCWKLNRSRRIPSVLVKEVVLDKVLVKYWEYKSSITFKLLSLQMWKLYK